MPQEKKRVGACAPCPGLFEDMDYWCGLTFFRFSYLQVGVYSEDVTYLDNVVVVVKASSMVASYGVYATPAPGIRAQRVGVVLVPLNGFVNLCVDECNCHFKICHFLDALPGLGVLFVLWCLLLELTENQLISRYKGTKNI